MNDDVIPGYICPHCGGYVVGKCWCPDCGQARAQTEEESTTVPDAEKQAAQDWVNPWT